MEQRANEAGLVPALQKLSEDLIDYVEARLRLLQAQVGGLVGKAGASVGLAAAALISLAVAYFLGLGLIVALLARVFNGHVHWPLLAVSLAHLAVAAVLVCWSMRSWNGTHPEASEPGPLPPSHAAESATPWTTPEISAN